MSSIDQLPGAPQAVSGADLVGVVQTLGNGSKETVQTPISVILGLVANNGAAATIPSLPSGATPSGGNSIVVVQGGQAYLVSLGAALAAGVTVASATVNGAGHLILTTGTGQIIDCGNVTGATGANGANITNLGTTALVTTVGVNDLVGISQNGADHAITVANFLGGETIDEFPAAAPASDTDTLIVGQGNSNMLAQTFGAVWTWMQTHLPSYKPPVVEILVNTTLDGAAHNGHILVVSQPNLTLTASATEGSGFSCMVINASSGILTLSSAIVTTSGVQTLNPGQIAEIYCVTFSQGTVTYAWLSAASTAQAPGQVVALNIGTLTYTSIALSWSAPITGGAATSYIVQYRITNSGSAWTQQASSVNSATIYGLQAATQYDLEVVAANTYGNGTPSAVSNATTPAAPTQAPGQVTSLATSGAAATSMTLSWAAPTTGGSAASYTAQYRVTGQTAWNTAATGITGTGYTVTGLTTATAYDFQVFAVNSAGNGTPSSVANGTTTVYAPGAPTALNAGTMTQTTAPMSWTAPTSGGAVATYTLQYRQTGSGSWTQQTGITGTSYTVTGLTAGTQYDFQVQAVNAGGQSAFTATTNATTAAGAPGTPTALTAGLTTVTTQALTWTAPTSGGAVATYSVRWSAHGANSWTTITGITGTGTTVTGLTRNSAYDFEVSAVNTGGSSAWTSLITTTTTNYKLSEGITPGANQSNPHGTGGVAFNVNINTTAGDGSCTHPSVSQMAFGTSNTVAPISGWVTMTAGDYTPGSGSNGYGHTFTGQYATVPATTGTWYVWYQALDASSNVQTQYCSIYTETTT